jgi:diketogulonate reductase-like aldo/keto reductase
MASNTTEKATFALNSGHHMPVIGLGSFDGFSHTAEELAAFNRAIKVALESGYRSLDCAEIYGNEEAIGDGLEEFLKTNQAGVTRKDLFITSKLFVHHHSRKDVREAVEGSLKKLKTDYLDLYLIHWPCPMTKVDGKESLLFDPVDLLLCLFLDVFCLLFLGDPFPFSSVTFSSTILSPFNFSFSFDVQARMRQPIFP